MAATATVDQTIDLGGTEKLYIGRISLDNSYPTGGEAIDVSGNERFDSMLLEPTSGGYILRWDAANQKVIALMGDNNNASDGPLIEVAATTDLSAVTNVVFWAIGG